MSVFSYLKTHRLLSIRLHILEQPHRDGRGSILGQLLLSPNLLSQSCGSNACLAKSTESVAAHAGRALRQ